MRIFVLPQTLLSPIGQELFAQLARGWQAEAQHAGWTYGGPNVDGWLFPEPVVPNGQVSKAPAPVQDFLRRRHISWVEAPILCDHRGHQPHFWPVVWFHHDADGVLGVDRCVLDQARRRGWFDSPFRHAPTAHALLAAQATPGRRLPPPTSIS